LAGRISDRPVRQDRRDAISAKATTADGEHDRPPRRRTRTGAQASDPDLAGIETPELYLGSEKNDGAIVASQDSSAGERSYAVPDSVPQNRFALEGLWKLSGDHATSSADGVENPAPLQRAQG